MIELRKIDLSNVWQITSLSVREDQQSFVAGNGYSMIEAFATRESGYAALLFGLYMQDEAVGFVMFGYDYMEGDPEVAKGNYVLVRFMIDQHYQGRGLGKAALESCLAYLRTFPCGPAQKVWLSYEPENTVAKALYTSAGFRENGEMCGGEIVAVKTL
ncbi:MAG: GNAT family N-acetyltransferase [Clostridiales bacterium]|nr:GNAT family N-acetyltransferase [Clostridiales bacterium]